MKYEIEVQNRKSVSTLAMLTPHSMVPTKTSAVSRGVTPSRNQREVPRLNLGIFNKRKSTIPATKTKN